MSGWKCCEKEPPEDRVYVEVREKERPDHRTVFLYLNGEYIFPFGMRPRIDIEESPDMEWRPAPDFKEDEL